MTDKTRINADAIIQLEEPFITVPLNQLTKTIRTSQKYVEKEIAGTLLTNIASLQAKSKSGTLKEADAVKTLDSMIERLGKLKRKFEQLKQEETLYTDRLEARLNHLDHLSEIPNTSSPEFSRWSQIRLERIIADYMLRNGFIESATRLGTDCHIRDFVDVELFAQSKKIEESLLARSCKEALAWCEDNKSALKKNKSSLEFHLRVQEFVQLVQKDKKSAIEYARKYLSPWADSHLVELQRAMALFCFPSNTKSPKHQALYDEFRWIKLIEQFRQEFLKLYQVPLQPLIEMTLQAGLAALKTPSCYQDANKNTNCPVCSATLGELAQALPHAHHVNSCIVCRISGKLINEDNPPGVLPNGNVYSMESLNDISLRHHGKIRDPRSDQEFQITDVKRAYIA